MSALPWSVSGSQPHSDSIPDHRRFEHVAITGDEVAVAATAGVSVASTSTGVVVTSTSALGGSLQSDHIPCHPPPGSDSTPDRLALGHTRATITDVSIAPITSDAAIVATTTGGDITRVRDRAPLALSAPSAPSALFSSHHATSIAIRRALTSTADADGPTNTASDPIRR